MGRRPHWKRRLGFLGYEAVPHTHPPENDPQDGSTRLFNHIYDNFSVAAAKLLPSSVVMSSCSDSTIPWYSSTYFSQLLARVGVQCRCLLYNHAHHADFVTHYGLKPPSPMPQAAANVPKHVP